MRSSVVGFGRIARMIILVLLLGVVPGCANRDVLTENLAEPLNGATAAKFDIDPGDGNLTIYRLTGDEPLLVGGELQYLENQGQPVRTVISFLDETTLTLQGGAAAQRWSGLPWAACNGATEWHLHLNPTVSSDIAAHSDGGNIALDLTGMIVTHVSADTGGGNIDLVLPDGAAGLGVTAETGAGDVNVTVPNGVAARIHATTGLGKVIVDPQFGQTTGNTYESSDYDSAANTVELTLHSGAGNVIVNIK